ncbi:hypothetical protein [Capillimicrobium parvum]|uniref:hypothetical protein n=1 Tax=Capillimicrobium parvum TaxID=2884022 RepID=UPI00216AD059|nr:hypothetical protein [Capillimicrobium parvum]
MLRIGVPQMRQVGLWEVETCADPVIELQGDRCGADRLVALARGHRTHRAEAHALDRRLLNVLTDEERHRERQRGREPLDGLGVRLAFATLVRGELPANQIILAM